MGRILFGAFLLCGGIITIYSAFVAPERFHDAALARWLPLVVYGIPGILLIVSGIRSRKKGKPSEKETSAPVVTAASKECPACHRSVESEARFCSRCGHSFEAPGKTPQQEVSKDQPPRIPDIAPQNPQTLQCAKCRGFFEWHDVYWQEQTPGRASTMFGDLLPRTFCPRCGALVTQYDPVTDKWLWVEGNKALNQQKPFPPDPILRTPGMNWWWDRRLPDGAVVPYSKNSLDLSLLESTQPPPAPAAKLEAGEDAYCEKCLIAQFKEEDEPRTWRSDPAFQKVLDPLNSGDYRMVCAQAENLLGSYGDFHLVYGWWATALLRMGSFEKAREVLNQGLEKSKRKYFLCKVFGEVEWKSGHLQDALYWWVQALHNQETLENRANDESAYLYLHYVAQGMGQPEIASAFLARVDQMRPGQIRLVETDAAALRQLARDAGSASAEKVLQKLRDRYFLGPQPAKTLTPPPSGRGGRFIMKKCPFCAEEIQEEAIKCRYCGEFLDQRRSPISPVASAPYTMRTSPAIDSPLPARGKEFPHRWFWPLMITELFTFAGLSASSDPKTGLQMKKEMLTMAIVALVITVILMCLFTHYLWKKIQDGKTRITPGKAVGYLFIPIFGVGWMFRVWAGYAGDLNQFRERHGLAGRASSGITVTFAIAWLLANLLGWTPAAPAFELFSWIMLMVFVAHTGKLVSDILEAAVALGWQQSLGADAASYCPKCRTGYREGFQFCVDCGVPLVRNENYHASSSACRIQ